MGSSISKAAFAINAKQLLILVNYQPIAQFELQGTGCAIVPDGKPLVKCPNRPPSVKTNWNVVGEM